MNKKTTIIQYNQGEQKKSNNYTYNTIRAKESTNNVGIGMANNKQDRFVFLILLNFSRWSALSPSFPGRFCCCPNRPVCRSRASTWVLKMSRILSKTFHSHRRITMLCRGNLRMSGRGQCVDVPKGVVSARLLLLFCAADAATLHDHCVARIH